MKNKIRIISFVAALTLLFSACGSPVTAPADLKPTSQVVVVLDENRNYEITDNEGVTHLYHVSEDNQRTEITPTPAPTEAPAVANASATVNPFDNLEVTFSGISGSGKAALTDKNAFGGLVFEIDKASSLANGDTVMVVLSNASSFAFAEASGYSVNTNEKFRTYTVSGLMEYTADIAEVPERKLEELITEGLYRLNENSKLVSAVPLYQLLYTATDSFSSIGFYNRLMIVYEIDSYSDDNGISEIRRSYKAAMIDNIVGTDIPVNDYYFSKETSTLEELLNSYNNNASLKMTGSACQTETRQYDSSKVLPIKDASVGQEVEYGTFGMGDGPLDGQQKLIWTVVARDETKVLLVSKYALFPATYGNNAYSYGYSNVYPMLNNFCINTMFTATEAAYILDTELPTKVLARKAEGGALEVTSSTFTAKLFALSSDEYKLYKDFIPEVRLTQRCKQLGKGMANSCWFLRDSYVIDGAPYVMGVDPDNNNSLFAAGINDELTVRPAMWVEIHK